VNGESLFLVSHSFAGLVQRILNPWWKSK